MLDATGPDVTVGPSILGLVTSGIYDDPLSIYREYVQNSVDELARLNDAGGAVEITLEPRQQRVSICDNGPGLTHQECVEKLVPISQSKKCLGRDRGFRGIGRLSGLAFAESVTFLTRASANDPLTRVVWSRKGLAGGAHSSPAEEHAFPNWVSVEDLDGCDYPEHFFRVEIDGISRHAAGTLLNREAVRGYIAEICPVPLASDFRFSKDVQTLFRPQDLPYSLRITLNGEEQPVERPYGASIALSGNREDHFHKFEEVRVPSTDGLREAAVGWIAHSSYLGAIPKGTRIRGIRARLGNIQIGDERVFDHIFEEERFNRWCVGEVHILDPRIVPNGRRDYFERNPHLRNLENHLAPFFGQITARCRAASSARNKEKRLMAVVSNLEDMYDLAASGYLTNDDAQSFVDQAWQRLAKARQELGPAGVENGCAKRLSAVEEKLRGFHGNDRNLLLSHIPSSEVDTFRKVFGAVATNVPSARTAREIIDTALKSINDD